MMGVGASACFWGRLWLLLPLWCARCVANREKAVKLAKAQAACGPASALKGSLAWAERLTATLVERSIALRAQQETALSTVKAVNLTCESRECTDRAAEFRKEAESAPEFCADVEHEARCPRDCSRTITTRHSHMAGEIDGTIGTLATHTRGKNGQNGVSCIGDGRPARASAIKSALAGYKQKELKACVTANAEEMDTATFEAEPKTHAQAVTLVDGSSDTNAVVLDPGSAEGYCAFFTGKDTSAAVLYSTGSADDDVAATWGGMWQIAKTNDGQNVKLHATGKDSRTLAELGSASRHRRDTQNTEGNSSSHQHHKQDARSSKLPGPAVAGNKNTERRRLARGMQRVCLRRMAREVDNKGAEHAEEWRRKQRGRIASTEGGRK
ncbi:hypothetical protein ERJ75_000541200 [Trypanosoma vivax]|uniref:Trypanosome variant surface glycoprotein B-type N-terminal domain-containing protein n=1 Tax=Trypanosoma vivax (strain Y486) TaxID=1055687 RepID=F9WLE4_TRYVY|nr:hypothetical protein ERJ75_000541200 [Trypanosoma vivax]CCD18335.1 hypothetical protein, conserved in T. vivax [Trypanosoma vivax Y486]|eukprot:CCD18335.1 hypothetical protein, conserved in T. vivax [Trypanosoma vivax Y486]